MTRKAKVFNHNILAGLLEEQQEGGYIFTYDKQYLKRDDALAVSLTLPLSNEPYISKWMFPFFDGLIPEGWLLNIASKNWKIPVDDRMGLLMNVCADCIGSVHIMAFEQEQS